MQGSRLPLISWVSIWILPTDTCILLLFLVDQVLTPQSCFASSCTEPIKQKHPNITYADLYQVVLQQCPWTSITQLRLRHAMVNLINCVPSTSSPELSPSKLLVDQPLILLRAERWVGTRGSLRFIIMQSIYLLLSPFLCNQDSSVYPEEGRLPDATKGCHLSHKLALC